MYLCIYNMHTPPLNQILSTYVTVINYHNFLIVTHKLWTSKNLKICLWWGQYRIRTV